MLNFIRISTLSKILENNKITEIYGLKIDIEGHEDEVLATFWLKASTKLLPKKIVIECMSKTKIICMCVCVWKVEL